MNSSLPSPEFNRRSGRAHGCSWDDFGMYPQGMVGCTGSRMMGTGPASQPTIFSPIRSHQLHFTPNVSASHHMQCNSHPAHICLHQLNYTSHPMWDLYTTLLFTRDTPPFTPTPIDTQYLCFTPHAMSFTLDTLPFTLTTTGHTTCYNVHTRHTFIHTKFNSHPISVLHTTCYVIHTQYTSFHTNYNSHIMLVLNTQTYIHLQISHQNPHNSQK